MKLKRKEVIEMDKYHELTEVMTNTPDNHEKLQLLEDWIAKASRNNDVKWEFETRLAQNEVAVNVGRYDLLMDNFSWCLDEVENTDADLPTDVMLRQYRWFLGYIDFFPNVSKHEVDEYFDHYKETLQKNTYSLRSYYQLRAYHALKSGYHTSLPSLRTMWLQEKRDTVSDGEWNEKQLLMRIHFELGEMKQGFTLASELQQAGFVGEDIPHKVYPHLLLPAWNEDRREEANLWKEQGYFLIKRQPKYLIEASYHLLYLAMTDIKKAYAFFLEHIQLADEQNDFYTRFYFYLASWCMLDVARAQEYHVNEDSSWFLHHVPELAEDFDARNGNYYFKETIDLWFSYIESR